MRSGDLPAPQIEMSARQLFDKLTSVDQNNVTRLMGGLVKSLLEQGLHGAIIGVGGVLTKQAPRKDVDCVIMLNTNRNRSDTEYDLAIKTMNILERVVRRIEEKSKGFFRISEIVEPKIDHMHEEIGLTLDEGEIQIQPQDGALIDLIPRNAVSLEEYVKMQSDPFAVLKLF